MKERVKYYSFIFVIMSIMGWIVEFIFCSILFNKIANPGFLNGLYCPIYGFGSLIFYIICKNEKKIREIINIFIYSTIFEYIVSLILQKITGKMWWNYTDYFLNINGRVCLLYSLIWVLIGMIFLHFIEPVINKIYVKTKKKILNSIICIPILLMVMDAQYSIFWKFIKML